MSGQQGSNYDPNRGHRGWPQSGADRNDYRRNNHHAAGTNTAKTATAHTRFHQVIPHT